MLPSRRLFLGSAALSAFYAGTASADDPTRTPKYTEGPFYPTKLPVDTDNDLLLLNDATAVAAGTVTHLTGRVLDATGSPLRNYVVEIWQCDANGAYLHQGSDNGGKRDQHFQGFGRFTTGSTGEYYFRTIKPVPYPGRCPHIHVKIKRGGKDVLVTQLFVKGEPGNAKDGIYNGVKDAKARASVTVAFDPMKESKVGELAAKFDIVLGVTSEEKG